MSSEHPRIQHVSIPRPPGSGATARAFYGDFLGLEELPVPESIRHRDLIWFRIGQPPHNLELHLFAEEPLEDRSIRHFCLEVEDQARMRERLEQAGYEPWDVEPIPGRPRFFCRDPFGNIIEFTTIVGNYQEAEQ
ncbi:MAG: VOC family protein [Candidatus Promineifilaceae bacterium]|nr:VOC family protein [Candidatus Promineifilaceae bacterium]